MSTRTHLLDTATSLAAAGESLSLDSVARAAHLSKPGLMYHFPTKQALMTALVDHVIDGYERQLAELADRDGGVEQRLRAYVDWCFNAEIDAGDMVMLADPRLREELTGRWAERLEAWVGVPSDLPPERRARLHAARLMADGSWFADATGCFPLPAADRERVADLARALVGDAS